MDVIETATADVQVNSAGATSYVNNYKIMNMLGEGTFSKVYLCQSEAGNEFVSEYRKLYVIVLGRALKVINKSILKRKREYKRVDGKLVLSNAFQKVQKEVAIMKKLAHSNLVRLYEVIDSPADDKLFLVLELIRGGQIMYWDDKKFRYLARNTRTEVLEKDAVRECMRDVVAALDFLHRNHICHRDIKPENILLAGDQYKLADFGVAHMNEDELPAAARAGNTSALRLRSTEGTYHFLAPECTTGDEYDPYQVDVWALGVTMFTLLLGTLPFGTSVASLSDVMTSISVDPLILPPDLDSDCAELLTQLLEKDPRLRITVPQLKNHAWLSGAGGDLARGSSGVEVMVTQQEIEAAFTPVNNFILVMKLKMKMSSRLNNARKSLAKLSDVSGARRAEAVPVTKHVPVSSPQPAEDKAEAGGELSAPKTTEMAPGEAMPYKVQTRSSRLVDSISETVGSLSMTRTRRTSQMGAISPLFDNAAPTASSPVQKDDCPGKADAGSHPGPLLRRLSTHHSRSTRSLIPDTPQRSSNEETNDDLPPGKSDADDAAPLTCSRSTSLVPLKGGKSPAKSDPESPHNVHRLTKRKSTSFRELAKTIGTPEGESASESSTSPLNRKKRRESLSDKGDFSSDLSAQSAIDTDSSPSKTEAHPGSSSPSRRLSRKTSMSFRALGATPELLATVEGDLACVGKSPIKPGAGSTVPDSPAAVERNGAPSTLTATTRFIVLSRRLSSRNSKPVRALSTLTDTPERVGSVGALPLQGELSPAKSGPDPVETASSLGDSAIGTSSTLANESPDTSGGASPPRPLLSPSRSDSSQPPGVLARRLSRRSTTSFCVFPPAIDTSQGEEKRKDAEGLEIKAPTGEQVPTTNDAGTSNTALQDAARSKSGGDTATSPRMSPLSSPLGSLKPKVNVNVDEEPPQSSPVRKAKLPVLDMQLSPTSSPVTSPAASPRNGAAFSDEEATPRRRPSSPSKTARLASLRASPLTPTRPSSLKLDEFSSSSDEGEETSHDPLPVSPKRTSPSANTDTRCNAPQRASQAEASPDRRAATFTAMSSFPLQEEDKSPKSPSRRLYRNRSMNAKVGGDPNAALTRESSLAKVLDACIAADDRTVEDSTSPTPSDAPVTPTGRHQVQTRPLIRPEDQPESTMSLGRHHHISPLSSSLDRMESSPLAVDATALDKSRPRRRSLTQAHDSLRALFRRKSSVRLSVLDEKRGAHCVTPDTVAALQSKVCGIM
ncbi:hypothetical protein PHYPSEUDO_010677 [Phytophthora pseudosyringae]|uniref:Protein kinase domain-containing protein n=1 Tax=Phytophthora pseudosyringae TaxID=221518 RepID=A0A8T1VD03_9STRA|nr:hypothetical protein PHYPSEUDO_010677 [Phytophthora pseudosyringae]